MTDPRFAALHMEECSSRRSAGGFVISRKEPSISVRETAENNRDQNVHFCSRVGCSSRLNPMKSAQIGSSNKAKTSRTPFHSSAHGKEIVGSSSRTSTAVNISRKSFSDPKKKFRWRLETDSETSSLQDESEEILESIIASGRTQMRVPPEPEGHDPAEANGSGPIDRLVKRNTRSFGLRDQDTAAGSSASFASKKANQGQGARNGASTSRYNVKNFRYNSISDVVRSGCSSSSDSSPGRRDVGRKRIVETEVGLSARGKKINGPMLDGRKDDNSNRGISVSDPSTRNLSPAAGNDAASVRSRGSTARRRLLNQENRNRSPLVDSPLLTPSSPQPDISLHSTAFSSENQLFARTSSNRTSSFSTSGSSSEHIWGDRSISPYEVGVSHSFMNRDTLRQCNFDGIAEMLLALERLEQEEEPSYEQLLLETSLFLGDLAFRDQHRDMRLDIDNMSYEELLALEERMGTVSTALPEEALAKCLKKSVYQHSTDVKEDEDDRKCSICQEEYEDGDEVGRLGCHHRYHLECIHQWLRLKNWCPICKASTTPLPLASPP